jgi:hypothetical protein
MVDHRKSSIEVAINISLQTQLSCYYHTIFQMYVGYLFMVLLIQWGVASLFLFIFNNPFGLAHCQNKRFGRSPKKEVS